MAYTFYQRLLKKSSLILLILIALSAGQGVLAQHATVLPGNGNFSGNVSPQGALRYQRGFFLVSQREMQAAGISSGMNINAIGFTLAGAQRDTTKGNFKVYLQNTTDLISRSDTGWTTVTSTTNSYRASGLTPGSYEWAVQANCLSNSAFTTAVNFSNNNLGGCNNPYNLETVYVGTDSASLTWESSSSPGFSTYQVEYKSIDSVNWNSANTTDTFFRVRGLIANKQYQWRVKTICGSKTSQINNASFMTASVNTCAAISGLTAAVTLQTQVRFSWTAVPTAAYYNLRFRRYGTSAWTSLTAATDTLSIPLAAGTSYEWQVRSICSGGTTGAFTASTVTTGGTGVCYEPMELVTRQISGTAALFSWKPVSGATYTIRYRLKRSITWTNAISPMTKTCDSLITIPDTTGAYDIPFNGGSSFTYNGGAVYIAWEYARPNGALTTSNLALTTTRGTKLLDVNGQDSITNLLSMISQADSLLSAMPNTLSETSQRPETRLGSSALKDSVAVIAVYALGHHIPRFQPTATISALISNVSATNKNYSVTLTVKEKQTGTQRYTSTKNLAVTAGDTAMVSFAEWAPSLMEEDSIIVTVPTDGGENVINNNTKGYLQNVNPSLLAYDDGSSIVAAQGFGIGSGLLLNKHIVSGCAQVIAAKVFLTESAKDKPVYAVIRTKAGLIAAQSATFTATDDDLNKYHSFSFETPQTFTSDTFYIGIAQPALATAYYPVGSQWEDAQTRTEAYYRSNLDGSALIDYPQGGRLMIKAEMISSAPEVTINGNLTLCAGATNTLTAGSSVTRFANSVKSFSSQYAGSDYSSAQVLSSPNVFPSYALSNNAWMSASTDGQREYLVLGFANPGKINFIDIFETANPGAVDSVFVKNPATGLFELVYTSTAVAAPQTARKNHISFTETSFDVAEIRIAINSPAVPGYNAIDAVGIGKETIPGTFSSYLWSGGGTGQTKAVTAAGTYTLTVTNNLGCTATTSANVVAALTTAPVVTASGSTALCPGDSVVLTSSVATGITWSNGATTPSITVNTAGTYSLVYNGGICGSLTSNSITVSINSAPTVSISGLLELCLGNPSQLSAGTGHSSYLWSTGATTPTISILSEGIYAVTVTNATGCKATDTVTASYAVLAAPTVTGNLNFCPGGSTTLDAGAGYSNYAWSNGATGRTLVVSVAGSYQVEVTNAAGCTAVTSVEVAQFAQPVPAVTGILGFCAGNSTAVTVDGVYASYLWSNGATTAGTSFNTAGNKMITVVDQNGCSGSKTINLIVFPNPNPAISGTLSFCGGTSTTLNAGTGYSSYVWNTGATTQTITVNTVGTYSVTVVNENGCSASASATTSSTGTLPASPGTITGAVIVGCNTTGNVYSIAAIPNSSHYVWKMPSGASISSGQGTTTINVNFSSAFAGGYIEVAASNACGQSPSITARKLYIQSLPAAPGSITGATTALCGPVTITYSIAAVPYATSYTWTAPAGVNILSGQGTRTISLRIPNNFGTGNLCVKANNACGSGNSTCISLTGKPPVPGTISGADNVCASEAFLPYSVEAIHGASSYTWTVPQGSQITSGQGTNRILMKAGSQNGNVTVKAVSNCGTSAVKSKAITIVNCNTISSFTATAELPQLRPVPEVISSYGGWGTGNNINMEWTMGETTVAAAINGEMLYTQGFHQPLVIAGDKPNAVIAANIQVTVYPNPVRTDLHVEFKTTEDRAVMLELFDNNGRQLQRKQVNTMVRTTTLQLTGYTAGTYFLVVKDMNGKTISSIKLIKTY
jgi:hypothetical protein